MDNNIHEILDQINEILYISDPDTYELKFVNRRGREQFGPMQSGAKCYQYLQNQDGPCDFCTNRILQETSGNRLTWVRNHTRAGNMLLHDSFIPYEGKLCRMELAVDVTHYVAELRSAANNLAAERKLVRCIEDMVLAKNLDSALDSVLQTLLTHYDADRAYIFQFNWEQGITSNTFEICREGVMPEKEFLQAVPIDVVSVWIDIFENQKKMINVIPDVEALKNDPQRKKEYAYLQPQNITNLITVPIFCSGKLHGFLGVDNPRSNVEAPELLTHVTYVAASELQRQTLNAELEKRSSHDQLTGVKNRFAYDETIRAMQNQKEKPVGIAFLDLNGLKWLNDNLGYDYGNKAICHLCEIMKGYFDPDTLYRISGDEFVIIWLDVGINTFMETCKALNLALKNKFDHLASIGYTWGTPLEDVAKLVQEATLRMQDEKRKFYEEKGQAEIKVRPAYLDKLLQEFRDSTFVLYLQPLYSIAEGRVYGAEGLVRKIDPHGKLHVPFEFIHMMEQERMISMVDYEMLRQACVLLKKWEDIWPDFRINCNMSRITLTETDYLERVDAILKETGVDPQRLTFEVTESSGNIQLESLASILDAIRQRGIVIAMDDLGTEASCLEMLYLPQIKAAKLDRSLICKAENSEREQIVISSMVDLCHKLGMICVAEGIETASQMELLKKMGCDRLQGYFIGKPMPPEEFLEWYGHANHHEV